MNDINTGKCSLIRFIKKIPGHRRLIKLTPVQKFSYEEKNILLCPYKDHLDEDI